MEWVLEALAISFVAIAAVWFVVAQAWLMAFGMVTVSVASVFIAIVAVSLECEVAADPGGWHSGFARYLV